MNNSQKFGLIIGQAPPEKTYKVPFARTRLYKWFKQVELEETAITKCFIFDALVGGFPGKSNGKHKIPTETEIKEYLPFLLKKITLNKTQVIIPVGKLAIQYVLNDKTIELSDSIGKKFTVKPFGKLANKLIVIPLPHPSGLSTWSFDKSNKKLLNKALELIKESVVS